MKNQNLQLRTKLAEALATLEFDGTLIPTYEEYVQTTTSRPVAFLTIGTMNVEAYLILLNQSSNDNSSKCLRNDLSSIQIQIVTVWPANKGGSKIAEQISENVMELLLDADGLVNIIELDAPFNAWKGEIVSIQNINFDDVNSRTWITQMVLEYGITQ